MPEPRARDRRMLPVAAALVVALALALACAAYGLVHAHPVVYDASGYWFIAGVYEAEGWFASHRIAGVRTYLYPTVLLGVSKLAAALPFEPLQLLFALQCVAHVASGALLARALSPGRPRQALALFALLACNPFALPYVASSLADALSLSCFQAWLAAMLACRREGGAALRWLALAALLAGIACALRPAYVWLLVLTPLLAPWWVAREVPARALHMVAVLLLMLPALAPQVAINQALFERATPLPAGGLGSDQLQWGIANLKYATAPADEGEVRMFYANPLAGTLRGDEGVGWYLRHPLRGAATLSTKFVGAFDFDYVMPYAWERHPPLQWLWRGLSLSLLLAGLRGLWLASACGRPGGVWMGGRALPPLVLAAWCAVTLPTALELRFSLPMLSLMVPLAWVAVADLVDRPARARLALLGAAAAGFVVLVLVARFVAAQNVLL